MGLKNLAILAVVCILALVPTSLGGPGVQAHLWLNNANTFPESETGYITADSDFTLYIANQANFGASNVKLIISIQGSIQGTLPSQVINITNNSGITTTIPSPSNDWTWGTPNATKTDGSKYEMPPSGTFPTYYAFYDMGPIGPDGDIISADVNITGGPTVRFDAWGFNSDDKIILRDPFSHNLTHVPEFPTIALPVVAVLAIMFLMHRRKKEG